MANPDFENLKQLQNPGDLPLTEASITNMFCHAQLFINIFFVNNYFSVKEEFSCLHDSLSRTIDEGTA